jgi:hypothetical protein
VDRNLASLQFLTQELSRTFPEWRTEENLTVRVFCSDPRFVKLPILAGMTLFLDLFQTSYGFNPVIGLPVYYERPDFDRELLRYEASYPRANFAVFCCGGAAFSKTLEDAVRGAKTRGIAGWTFSPEIFEFVWFKPRKIP